MGRKLLVTQSAAHRDPDRSYYDVIRAGSEHCCQIFQVLHFAFETSEFLWQTRTSEVGLKHETTCNKRDSSDR